MNFRQPLQVLDLGSHSCRLLLFDKGTWPLGTMLYRKQHGLFGTSLPTAEALDTLLQEVSDRLMPDLPVVIRATGTFREMPELLAQAQHPLRQKICLLPAEEEARLATLGAVAGLPENPRATGWLVIDMGGGSTEIGIVSGTGRYSGGASFAVGSHSERETTEIALTKIETFLDHKYHEIQSLDTAISCGAATRLALQYLKLPVYHAEAIHGCRIPMEALTHGEPQPPESWHERALLAQILAAARKRWITVSECGWPQALAVECDETLA